MNSKIIQFLLVCTRYYHTTHSTSLSLRVLSNTDTFGDTYIISISLRVLGNHDSTWKTDFLLNELDQIWMNIFELLLQFIHYNMCLSCRITIFKHPQQKEMCWRVWWRFLWHPHPHGRTRVYMCIYRKSREIGTKNINSNDFFLTEIFFSIYI